MALKIIFLSHNEMKPYKKMEGPGEEKKGRKRIDYGCLYIQAQYLKKIFAAKKVCNF